MKADLIDLPPEAERYFVAPMCREADAPIHLEGPWLSIPGTNANVEPEPYGLVPKNRPTGVEALPPELLRIRW